MLKQYLVSRKSGFLDFMKRLFLVKGINTENLVIVLVKEGLQVNDCLRD